MVGVLRGVCVESGRLPEICSTLGRATSYTVRTTGKAEGTLEVLGAMSRRGYEGVRYLNRAGWVVAAQIYRARGKPSYYCSVDAGLETFMADWRRTERAPKQRHRTRGWKL